MHASKTEVCVCVCVRHTCNTVLTYQLYNICIICT